MKRYKLSMLHVLFVVFILMGALLYFSDNKQNNPLGTVITTPSPTPQQVVFSGLTGGEITAIQLFDPNSRTRLTLEYTNTGWQALEYPNEVISQQEISYILTTLANLPYQRSFPVDATSQLGQYGFYANGQYLFGVQFITMDGNGHVLAIGNPASDHMTPTPNQAFYALVDDLPEMYLVSAPAVYYLIDKMTNPPLE